MGGNYEKSATSKLSVRKPGFDLDKYSFSPQIEWDYRTGCSGGVGA